MQDVTKRTLSPVPCPVCGAAVDGVIVDEESINNAKRVPIIVPTKCDKSHAVVLFVDRNFTVRDVEAAAEAVQDSKDAVDKAQGRYFSLERLTDWIDRVRDNAPDCQLIFVGNKVDERRNGQGVALADGREFASKYGAACVEVSAKTGEGISELFEVVARSLASEN